MRESNKNLDSFATVDARHLQTASQPGEQSSDVTNTLDAPAANSQQPDPRSLPAAIAPEGAATSENSVYTAASLESDVWHDRVLTWLQQHVPQNRLQHILRVEQMSAELAPLHHVQPEQAAQAGLLHDLAKFFKPQRLLAMAQAEGLELDPVDVVNPHLLHADVGAIVARDEFGIQDVAILNAIRHHTLGRPGMSDLSCVVFLADSLEPGRGDTPELTALRQLSQQDLHRAVWQTCDYALRYLMSGSRLIHPRMILTRNWAMGLAHQKLPEDSALSLS